MAKRKKTKNPKSSISYSVELTGLILILIGIIGFGFGYIGTMIKKFSMFLAGTWWILVLIGVLYVGIYMLFKRKMPKFFSSKLVGIYVLIAVILIASHLGFTKEGSSKDIIIASYNNYMERMSTITSVNALNSAGTTSIVIGGGLVGAVFTAALFSLFGGTGAKIILVILTIFGSILAFNINLNDLFQKVRHYFSRFKKKEPSITLDELGDLQFNEKPKVDKDDKVIITSIDQIKSKTTTESLETNSSIKENNYKYKYYLPHFDILDPIDNKKKSNNPEITKNNKIILEKVIKDFGIEAKVVKIHVGPTVTQYEVIVPQGTKVSRISGINKEIALALAARDVRIEAPIPGKSTIGIEIPNQIVSTVQIREVLEETASVSNNNRVYIALGKDIMGKSVLEDITKMPHLLVAGSTGSGKSVCINAIIASILMRYKPEEVKLVLIDPKKVELTNYNEIPHLFAPVVNEPNAAANVLKEVVKIMEGRYQLFSEKEAKNILAYNDWVYKENKKRPESPLEKLPYIVVIIDELADLMLVAAKEVESSILRITQMARAAGIHLIAATQRPSTDVITGLIKNNIPSRIAFSVSSQIDSRTILDMGGAEKLLGKGDMLYLPMGESTPKRIQGCFIRDEEIKNLIEYCKKQEKVKYDEKLTTVVVNSNSMINGHESDEPMYDEVVDFAIENGNISASLIQRRFRFGYNRAARMIDLLESRGIVGPPNGSKPREVLIKSNPNE